MRRTPVIAGAAVLGAGATLQVLGRTAGSTATERRALLPGDELVARPQLVTDHAATIAAPPERVWPWLTQMGWHRGGFYTPGWVDRVLFPANRPSADRLDPQLVRDLRVGDTIPDGPPGTAEYVVVEVEAPRVLVLRSTTHVPPGWDEKHDARIVWTWAMTLAEPRPGTCRLHLRVRGRMSPPWFAALYVATIVPSDLVMALGMLRGLRRRVEESGTMDARPRGPSPLP